MQTSSYSEGCARFSSTQTAALVFQCFTCGCVTKTETLRVCLTCRQTSGSDQRQMFSSFVFCNGCFIDNHMELGHKQQKLLEYCDDIEEVRNACRVMKPAVLGLISKNSERLRRYQKLKTLLDLLQRTETKDKPVDVFRTMEALNLCFMNLNKVVRADEELRASCDVLSECFEDDLLQELENLEAVHSIQPISAELFAKIPKILEILDVYVVQPLMKREEEKCELEKDEERKKTKREESSRETCVTPVYLNRLDPVTTPSIYRSWSAIPSQPDRLQFSVSHKMFLCGLEVYGAWMEPCEAMCRIRISSPKESTELLYFPLLATSHTSPTVRKDLAAPFQVFPQRTYLLEMTVDRKAQLHWGANGKNECTIHGDPAVTVKFYNCTTGIEGTKVDHGQFPGLYLAIDSVYNTDDY